MPRQQHDDAAAFLRGGPACAMPVPANGVPRSPGSGRMRARSLHPPVNTYSSLRACPPVAGVSEGGRGAADGSPLCAGAAGPGEVGEGPPRGGPVFYTGGDKLVDPLEKWKWLNLLQTEFAPRNEVCACVRVCVCACVRVCACARVRSSFPYVS